MTLAKKHVLIVEDNDLNMRLFNDLLEASGYEPRCLQDGVRVPETIRETRPDLVLMDIQLPEISGLDLIAIIKQDEAIKDIPVIAITAFAMRGDEEKIKEAGFVDYISKPISVVGFIETVGRHLADATKIGQTVPPVADSAPEAQPETQEKTEV